MLFILKYMEMPGPGVHHLIGLGGPGAEVPAREGVRGVAAHTNLILVGVVDVRFDHFFHLLSISRLARAGRARAL